MSTLLMFLLFSPFFVLLLVPLDGRTVCTCIKHCISPGPKISSVVRSRYWNVVAERSSALDSSSSVVRMWVRISAWPVAALVPLSETLNHNCFVLRMGRKAVCCVMHIKEPRTLIVKEKGLAPVFLDSCLEHPAGWICPRNKSSVLLLLLLKNSSCFGPDFIRKLTSLKALEKLVYKSVDKNMFSDCMMVLLLLVD